MAQSLGLWAPFTNLPFGICGIYFDLKVPSLKLTAKATESRSSKTRKFIFQPLIFKGYVSFRDGSMYHKLIVICSMDY